MSSMNQRRSVGVRTRMKTRASLGSALHLEESHSKDQIDSTMADVESPTVESDNNASLATPSATPTRDPWVLLKHYNTTISPNDSKIMKQGTIKGPLLVSNRRLKRYGDYDSDLDSDGGGETITVRIEIRRDQKSIQCYVSELVPHLNPGRLPVIKGRMVVQGAADTTRRVQRVMTKKGHHFGLVYEEADRTASRSLSVSVKVYSVPGVRARKFASYALTGGLAALRRDGSLCDVTLLVGDRRFPAHRLVLAANSEVFRRMLAGSDEASKMVEARNGLVQVEDVDPNDFSRFLDFMYTADIGLIPGHELELLRLADRYMVDTLRSCCDDRLLEMDGAKAVAVLKTVDAMPSVVSARCLRRAATVVLEEWDWLSSESAEWTEYKRSLPPSVAALLEAARDRFDHFDKMDLDQDRDQSY